MGVSILNYRQSITNLPTYNDGIFEIFQIKTTDDTYSIEYIKTTRKKMYFEELSISDKLRFEAEQRDKNLTLKIRIPQTKEITSMNVLKIGKEYHKVYNVYHFTNKDGFKQSDLTLIDYPNVRLEGDLWKSKS